MENLTLVCAGHHGAVHRGEIVITGKAPAIVVTRNFEVPHVGASPSDEVVRDAVLALTTLGATKRDAERAVAGARARVGPDAELEALLKAALRECSW